MGEGIHCVAIGDGDGAGVRRRAARVALGAVLVMIPCFAIDVVSTYAGPPKAHSARTLALRETGHLHLTSKHGFTLNEQGTVSGTIAGTIYIHLHLVSSSRVTAEVNIYPSSGSLSGSGSSSYQVRGAFANFSGTLAVNRGSGTYRRAHATALRFTGAIQRRNDSVTVQLSGALSV
jgi:hypothetical protein